VVGCGLGVGIVLAMAAYTVVGAKYLAVTHGGQLSPGVLPVVVGTAAIVLGLCYLREAVQQWRRRGYEEAVDSKVGELLVAMSLFVFSFSKLGFIVAGVLFGAYFLRRFHGRKWSECLLLSISLTAVFWFTFAVGFQVPVPLLPS